MKFALRHMRSIARGWVRRVCSSNIEKVAPNKKVIEPETVQNTHFAQIRFISDQQTNFASTNCLELNRIATIIALL